VRPLHPLFPARTALLIVIHAETQDQVLRNAARAFDNGADGVFLINHRITEAELSACYDALRSKRPEAWIGLSFLGRGPSDALALMPPDASGLWVGDAGVHEAGGPSPQADAFRAARAARNWAGLYFGGVAFKHQRPVADVAAAAAAAAAADVDVVTTSGEATGRAAPVEKIAAMKAALGDHPLAVASGVTPENVHRYAGLLDAVLVATGVSDCDAELNPARIGRLARALG
jgi:hypothetical protein